MITKKMRIKSILNYIGSVISWTLFSILIICAAFLLYYFVSLKLYEAKGSDSDFYIYNPLELVSADIEPGWNGTYVLKIKNDADYAVAYKIVWRDVFNDFTDVNNLDYFITRSNISYLNNLKAPRKETFLDDEVLIRRKTTVKYVLRMNWKETGINQNIDSGKTFKGKLYIETIK